jgi:hypothetical protein
LDCAERRAIGAHGGGLCDHHLFGFISYKAAILADPEAKGDDPAEVAVPLALIAFTCVTRSWIRSRSASATADRIVNTSLLMPLWADRHVVDHHASAVDTPAAVAPKYSAIGWVAVWLRVTKTRAPVRLLP